MAALVAGFNNGRTGPDISLIARATFVYGGKRHLEYSADPVVGLITTSRCNSRDFFFFFGGERGKGDHLLCGLFRISIFFLD